MVEEGASVWYGAVVRRRLRAGDHPAGANVRTAPCSTGRPAWATEVGPARPSPTTAWLHGAHLGEECLVANGAVVLDGARVGSRALLAAGSVLIAGGHVPDGMLAAGAPAVVKRPIAGTPSEFWVNANPGAYADLAQRHRLGVAPA